MRGSDTTTGSLFSYVDVEGRIPVACGERAHPPSGSGQNKGGRVLGGD
jgi:hypothetical protein